MVLDLLIRDEEDGDDDRRGRATGRDRNEYDEHSRDRRSRERDQVEERDQQAEGDDVRHTGDPQDDARRDAGDQADQEVPGHVAADGAVHVVSDPAPARLLLLGQHTVDAVHPRGPFEQHEERHEHDGQGRRDRRENALRDGERSATHRRQILAWN